MPVEFKKVAVTSSRWRSYAAVPAVCLTLLGCADKPSSVTPGSSSGSKYAADDDEGNDDGSGALDDTTETGDTAPPGDTTNTEGTDGSECTVDAETGEEVCTDGSESKDGSECTVDPETGEEVCTDGNQGGECTVDPETGEEVCTDGSEGSECTVDPETGEEACTGTDDTGCDPDEIDCVDNSDGDDDVDGGDDTDSDPNNPDGGVASGAGKKKDASVAKPKKPKSPTTPTTPTKPKSPTTPTTPKTPTTPTTPKSPTSGGMDGGAPSPTGVTGSDGGVPGFGPPKLSLADDRDQDGLHNDFETNTGKFVDAKNTGTNPDKRDSDLDGLSDGEEVHGTALKLDLPKMGVSPVHRDLLLEYDWFEEAVDCAQHSHKPSIASLDRVTKAFADAPVKNIDGQTGIHVIHDYGQGGVFTGGTTISNPVGVITGEINGEVFIGYKKNFDSNRSNYFHYVLMAHRYSYVENNKVETGSSGNAEFEGSSLMVTTACWGKDDTIANTIMHELGHNLGLDHGGAEPTNNKPNYNSVMNYFYQFDGVDTDCAYGGNGKLDFSHNKNKLLSEPALSEAAGICNNVAIDWNDNGVIDPGTVKVDINEDMAFTDLHDFDDWSVVLSPKDLVRVVVNPVPAPICPGPPGT